MQNPPQWVSLEGGVSPLSPDLLWTRGGTDNDLAPASTGYLVAEAGMQQVDRQYLVLAVIIFLGEWIGHERDASHLGEKGIDERVLAATLCPKPYAIVLAVLIAELDGALHVHVSDFLVGQPVRDRDIRRWRRWSRFCPGLCCTCARHCDSPSKVYCFPLERKLGSASRP